ncbi:hypothetical protein ACQB60_03795 [Actinomycetota bacterium Odt1-20B]
MARAQLDDGGVLLYVSGQIAEGAVRTRYLTGAPPTSTTVEVPRLFRPEALIEIDVVAAVNSPAGQSA